MLNTLMLAGVCGWMIGAFMDPRGWLLPRTTLAKPYSFLIGALCMVFNLGVLAIGLVPLLKWSIATSLNSVMANVSNSEEATAAFVYWLFGCIVGTVIVLWVFYGIERLVQHWWHNRQLGAIDG